MHRYGIDNEFFLNILRARETFIALRPIQSISGLLSDDLDIVPEFFWRHAGHEIVLENGYGQEYLGRAGAWSESRFE